MWLFFIDDARSLGLGQGQAGPEWSLTCHVSMNCAVVDPGDADSATNLPSS